MNILKQYQKHIDNFINVLSQDKDVDLSIFNDNLKSLKIIVKDNNENYPAGYDRYNNIIRLKNDDSITSLYHELLHAASTKKEGDFIYSGLSQEVVETKLLLGLGLTEGITELLREQYFGQTNSYFLEKFYVKKLSEIVSEKSVKDSYFKADNETLMNELMNYATFDEIKLFLHNLDTYTISMQNPETADIEKIQESITKCSDFLVTTYYNKLNEIDCENIDEKMEDYANSFNWYIIEPSLNNQEFGLFPSKDILEKTNVLKSNNNSKAI